MIKKRKGFSLAEVLITLMIVGVVASATIPTVTKRTTGQDKLWDWADYPLGSSYFAGSNVLLDGRNGNTALPSIISHMNAGTGSVNKENVVNAFFPDLNASNPTKTEISQQDMLRLMDTFKPQDDKLIILDNYTDSDGSVKQYNSHMSFYNIIDKGSVNQYEYAGRLASDRYNLALGAGALERNKRPEENGGRFNTAIGHLTSMSMEESSYSTTLGRYNLIEYTKSNISTAGHNAAHNVAIGNKAQNYNMQGHENTAVGYRALNGIDYQNNSEDIKNAPNVNVGIGYESLGALGSHGDPESGNTYLSRNIGIGYRAGYRQKNLTIPSDVSYEKTAPGNKAYNNQVMRLFLTNSEVQPFHSKINYNYALYGNSKIGGSELDMSADEIIVNTADGKHTILKIDLTGTKRALPKRKKADSTCEFNLEDENSCEQIQMCASTYSSLGYCTGEGSEDLKKLTENSIDSSALADVCIAKFNDLVYIGGSSSEKITNSDTVAALAKALNLAVEKPVRTEYTDWDIYIKGLDVAFNTGTMTGKWEHSHIQTVKASLNYLENWKEGQGVISNFLDSLHFNIRNFFTSLFGNDTGGLYENAYTLSDYIAETIDRIISNIGEGVDKAVDFVDKLTNKLEEATNKFFGWLSDARLKDVSGASTAGLKEINALKIKNYTYKNDKNKTPHVGVIAQELQKVFPNSVVEGSDGYLKIKQEEMFFAMVNAIQELDVQDKELNKQIPKLNKEIKQVVQKNKALINKNEKLKAENEKLNAQLKLLEAQQ